MWRKCSLDPSSSNPLSPSIGLSPEAFVGWYDRIKKNFEPFRPETRSMMINFSRKSSTIGLQIKVPDGFRKNHSKIKIPAYAGFTILKMVDEVFHEHKYLWQLIDGFYELDAKNLPSSERYLIELEGGIDESALKKLVHIKPAANRDNDEEHDKYWLESSIRQPDVLDKLWDDLEIDEVDIGVYVDIDKMFGLTIPQEMKDKAESIRDLLTFARHLDRNALIRGAIDYKRQEERLPSFNPNDFYSIVNKLTARNFILQHLEVDRPYNIGTIDQPDKFVGLVPQNIKVQTLTTLTLREPTALGYLKFKRKLYMDKLKNEFGNIS